MTVTVAPARPEDAPAVSRLLAEYLTVTEQEKAERGLAPHGPLPQRYQDEIDRPDELLAGTLLAREATDRRPLGLVVLHTEADRVEMKRLWVDPRARGTGAGRALVRAVIEQAADREVTLTVWDWRAAPIGLYRSLGFVDTPSEDPREHLLAMMFQSSR
ncbi:GNAT family N-acetyltransferase [Kineosporia rhizophila]|uniref:GNAT family N-acetyltransferase n=1 Tax=Kineosporia rhizophila TaxID=84633 RepID=UPI000AF65346|nr:GNAT family N-acetyltransferase [Kineosporia rhizophila]MCE0540173.1 GNAT family N-acetyltransferase [Kineosporia rhizophila]